MSHEKTPDAVGQKLVGDESIAKVRELLTHFRSAMFVTAAGEGAPINVRPMGLQHDAQHFGGSLWFFADDRSGKVQELNRNPRTSLIFQNDEQSRYLHLVGVAAEVRDETKMRELYSAIIKTWFPKGLDDPHLTLIRFDATHGAFWDQPGGLLHLLASFTKAVVTGIPGKGGRMGTVEM